MVYFKLNLEIKRLSSFSPSFTYEWVSWSPDSVKHLFSLTRFPWWPFWHRQSGSSFSKAEVCPLTAILPTISLLAREVGDTQQPCILSHLRILRLGTHGDSKGPPFPLHTVWLSRFKILKTDPMNKMLTGLTAVYFLGISSNFFLKKRKPIKISQSQS